MNVLRIGSTGVTMRLTEKDCKTMDRLLELAYRQIEPLEPKWGPSPLGEAIAGLGAAFMKLGLIQIAAGPPMATDAEIQEHVTKINHELAVYMHKAEVGLCD